MNGFLLDTSVISTFAPDRPPVPEGLQSWILRQGERETLFVSSITIAETQRGISKLRRSGGAARADRLENWLASLLLDFDQRVISIDADIGRVAGRMEDAAIAVGRNPGLADILIAATAHAHDLLVLTANARHFAVLGIPNMDPFSEELPD